MQMSYVALQKSSSQLWCFLTFELVSDKKSCDIIEIEDTQNRIFCYNNTLQSSWGMRRRDEKKTKTKTKKPGWHKFVGEWGIWWLQYRRYLGCHFGVCKCQLLRATPTSAAVPIQTLCRCQSSLLWIDLYKRRRRRRRRRRRKCSNTNSSK